MPDFLCMLVPVAAVFIGAVIGWMLCVFLHYTTRD
jgi:F0F1-type ATP synthase assembly protein I